MESAIVDLLSKIDVFFLKLEQEVQEQLMLKVKS